MKENEKSSKNVPDETAEPRPDVCLFDRRSGILMLPPGFQRRYRTESETVRIGPEPVPVPDCVQPETAGAFRETVQAAHRGEGEGGTVIGLRSAAGSGYIPVHVSWKSLFWAAGHESEIAVVVAPFGARRREPSGARSDELADLRAKTEMQARYIQSLMGYQEQLRQYRHNRKNNIIAVMALLRSGDLEGARSYMEEICADLPQKAPIVSTGNTVIDALVSEKILEACESGIHVDQIVGLSPEPKIEVKDLCVAVGCALDNAIEGCEKAKERYPLTSISLRLIEKQGVVTFYMENTSVTPPGSAGAFPKTAKTDKLNHGFGLRNIAAVVKKYSGYLEIRPEEGRFITRFTLFPNA